MKKYLHKLVLVGALMVGFVGNNVWAEDELDTQTMIEESKITLNAETVLEIPQLPIVFEGVTYQPNEYTKHFEEGLEITVYLIQDIDNNGNDALYAFLPEIGNTRVIARYNTRPAWRLTYSRGRYVGCTYYPNYPSASGGTTFSPEVMTAFGCLRMMIREWY